MTVPLVTVYPDVVPDPFGSQTANDFTVNSFDFTKWQADDLGPEFNASITQFNIDVVTVNDDAAAAAASADSAAAAANNLGLWSNLVGAVNVPASVNHNDSVWVLDADNADITTIEPGVSGWTLVTSSSSKAIPQSGGGTLTAGGRTNQLKDGDAYFTPLANSVDADVELVVELEDYNNAFKPSVAVTGGDLYRDRNGTDTVINFTGATTIKLTSNGVDEWRL